MDVKGAKVSEDGRFMLMFRDGKGRDEFEEGGGGTEQDGVCGIEGLEGFGMAGAR